MPRAQPGTGSSRTSLALTVITVLAVLAALYLARDLLIPIALAVLVALTLAPLVRALERIRIHRPIAIAFAVGAAAVLSLAVVWFVQRQLYGLAAKLPEYRVNLVQRAQSLRGRPDPIIEEASSAINEIGKEIAGKPNAAAKPPADASDAVPVRVVEDPPPPLFDVDALFGSVLSQALTAGIVLIFTIAFLVKREDIRARLVRLFGVPEMHRTSPALDDAARRVSCYLVLQVCTNAALGAAIGLGLLLIGLPGALLFGALIGLLRFIPYVGVWIGAALPVIVSLATSTGWTQPALVLGLVVVVEALIANLAEPILFGAKTGVSPLAVLLSVVFWGWLWGPIGLLLATPLTVCLAVLGSRVPRLGFLGVLLSDRPALNPDARLYERLLAGDPDGAAKITAELAADRSLIEMSDGLLLPALRLAESDRHAGELTPEQSATITETMTALLDDVALPGSGAPAPLGKDRPARVIIIPARDAADELAARLLLLSLPPDLNALVTSSHTLSGEVIEQLGAPGVAAVCISALPPDATFHARVLAKRLRARFASLPILIGYWDSSIDPPAIRAALGAGPTEHVTTTFVQAVQQLRSLASLDPRPHTALRPEIPRLIAASAAP